MVVTGGAGQRALDRAFEQLFGVSRAFAEVELPGRTDPLIIADAWRRHQPADAAPDLEAFRECYAACLAEELLVEGPGKRVLPGIQALLDELAGRDDIVLALLTGNYQPTARLKLEHFALWHYFTCGAFGDDAEHRNGLVPVAMRRAGALTGAPLEPARVVVIGDTPHDVACAQAGGVRSIAVATGGADRRTLDRAGADAVFDDLGSTAEVVAAIEALTA